MCRRHVLRLIDCESERPKHAPEEVLGRSGGSGAWQSLSAGSDTAKTLRAPRAPLDDLASWLRIERKDSLRTRLRALDGDKLVLHHPKSGRYHIPEKGVRYVDKKNLARPV